MAEKKRQCGTCRFFAKSESGLTGRCTHPKRDKAHLDLLLLRPSELGCRTRWGTSLWQDPADDRDPVSPDHPQQPTFPDPIPAQLHYDDEVTSVSIAGSKAARPSFEDDVVDSGAVASGVGSWSDSVQEERRRLLMHGSQEALAGARKRHIEKQSRQRDLIPFADEVAEPAAAEEPNETSVEAQPEATASSEPIFPADDFVEEERASETDTPHHNDELVDDGFQPRGSRSSRGRRLMRDTKSPKDRKAMVPGVPTEMVVTSHNPEQRGEWNTVPGMTPGFDLPLATHREHQPPASGPIRITASAAPTAYSISAVRPVSQARELMSEERLRQERARRRVVAPIADLPTPEPQTDESESPVTHRPRLQQAPPDHAAPVERLRTSPLRGYHPAVKAPVANNEHAESARFQPEAAPSQHIVVTPARSDQDNGRVLSRQTFPTRTEDDDTPERAQASARPLRPRHEGADSSERHETPARPPRPHHEDAGAHRTRIEHQAPTPLTPFKRSAIRIAPQVPRACGTCASFRPSGVDGRGSCGNAFAGPVQRVVNAQGVGCQHTFGSFWLPADEHVWRDELNEDFPATPRVDRMIARHRERRTVVLPDLDELTS